MSTQGIVCTTAETMLRDLQLANRVGHFIHADPPWMYSKAAPPKHGRQDGHYDGMSMVKICLDLDRAYDIADPDCYLAVWCTWPTIWEFARAWFETDQRWQSLTGGAWGKTGERPGIGFHMLGTSEPLMIFRKGNPRPKCRPPENLWTTVEWEGGYWEAPRGRHSAKPKTALRDLIMLATAEDDLVVDLYAGESASLATVAGLMNRNYVGAEADQTRWQKAVDILKTLQVAF